MFEIRKYIYAYGLGTHSARLHVGRLHFYVGYVLEPRPKNDHWAFQVAWASRHLYGYQYALRASFASRDRLIEGLIEAE